MKNRADARLPCRGVASSSKKEEEYVNKEVLLLLLERQTRLQTTSWYQFEIRRPKDPPNDAIIRAPTPGVITRPA